MNTSKLFPKTKLPLLYKSQIPPYRPIEHNAPVIHAINTYLFRRSVNNTQQVIHLINQTHKLNKDLDGVALREYCLDI